MVRWRAAAVRMALVVGFCGAGVETGSEKVGLRRRCHRRRGLRSVWIGGEGWAVGGDFRFLGDPGGAFVVVRRGYRGARARPPADAL